MIEEPAVAFQAQLGKAFPGFAAGVVQGRRQLTVASDGFPEQWVVVDEDDSRGLVSVDSSIFAQFARRCRRRRPISR